MRLFSLFSICCFFITLASALPQAIPVEDTEFDLETYFEDMIEERGLEKFFYDDSNDIGKRDEKTIEQILLTVNKSGLLWKGLDALAGHPKRIGYVANTTAKLLKASGSLNYSYTKGLNYTDLLDAVKASGLVNSVADGILLDDDYRKVLVKLIERIVEPNIDALGFIINQIFQKKQKRDSQYGGSLQEFAGNIATSFLGSKIFSNSISDVLNALNDTGVAVYIAKRFIADESYQNMTADLVKDIYHTGALKKLSAPKINITELVGKALGDPQAITKLFGKILVGDTNIGSTFGKYTGAVKKIVKDLENDGLFEKLNEGVFPSSAGSSPKTTTSAKKAVKTTPVKNKQLTTISMYGNNKEQQATSSSGSGAMGLQQASNVPIAKALVYLQTLIFGGALLLI